MTSRSLLSAAALATVLLAASSTVRAIADGEPDGADHPYVGLMVAQDENGTPLWRCSGTLITKTVFLTAGHCTEPPAAQVEIWFDDDVESAIPANGYPTRGEVSGTPYTHPRYAAGPVFVHDIGVVVLDQPFLLTEYAQLPEPGALDRVARRRGRQDITFTTVGYGLQASVADVVSFLAGNIRIRMASSPRLLQINSGFTGTRSLLLSNSGDLGTTCFGDSGGPNFIGTSRVVGAVTSFGVNGICSGTGGAYRVDRKDDLDWLAAFLR